MDPVLIILSEMISYEGSSVRRCMRRLTTPDGAGGGGGFGARHSSYIFPNPVEPNARDDAGGGGASV
jgi:hypothetical protein